MEFGSNEVLYTRFGISHKLFGDVGIQISELHGRRSTVLDSGPLIASLLDKFCGGARLDKVVGDLAASGVSDEVIRGAVSYLVNEGFLFSNGDIALGDPIQEVVLLAHPRARDPSFDFAARIAGATFAIVGEGLVAAQSVAAMKSVGVLTEQVAINQIEDWLKNRANPLDVVVACADFEDFATFRRINDAVIATQCRGYFTWLTGAQLTMGPFVVAKHRPCFACFADRFESNIMFIQEFRNRTDGRNEASKESPLAKSALIQQGIAYNIALDLLWHLAGRSDRERVNKVRYLDLATGTIEESSLLRAPRCSACGSAYTSQPQWGVRDLL